MIDINSLTERDVGAWVIYRKGARNQSRPDTPVERSLHLCCLLVWHQGLEKL